jgi:hypothetical protein
VPNTRTALPPFLPQPAPGRVAPDAPTLPPVQPPRPRSTPWPLIAIGVVVVLVAAVVVLVNLPPGDRGTAAQPPGQSTAATVDAPDVALENHRERLGFEIGIPADWQRASSIDGALSSVTWEGRRTDPKVGTLKVEVQRYTGESGVSAIEVLRADDEAQGARRQTSEYRRVELSGNDSSADFECTYRAGAVHHRVRTRAVVSGALFELTFSLYAGDPGTLAQHWAAVEPLMAEIRGSFRPVES